MEDGFLHEGIWITDPTRSSCGRFGVNPVEEYGEAYLTWLSSQRPACEVSDEHCEGDTYQPVGHDLWFCESHGRPA